MSLLEQGFLFGPLWKHPTQGTSFLFARFLESLYQVTNGVRCVLAGEVFSFRPSLALAAMNHGGREKNFSSLDPVPHIPQWVPFTQLTWVRTAPR